MRQLAEEIYTALSGIGDTYFQMLEKNPDTKGLLIVYELNESNSYNTLDSTDYANDVSLTVKLLHPDTMELLRVGKLIKSTLLQQQFEQCKNMTFSSSVPIFEDRDLRTNQLTLLFSLYKPNPDI
jgi:hypothetical protein